MKTPWKQLLKTLIFLVLNPHILALACLGFVLLSLWKSIYYIADKMDDMARNIRKLDSNLASKEYPSWFRSLLD